MKTPRLFAALLVGTVFLAPACSTTRGRGDQPISRRYSAFDEGFKRGLMAGGWAGYRDFGKPYRKNYWNDGQYRQGTEGYRLHYGSKTVYTDGFRAGYERGYRDRRERENRGRKR